MRRLPLILFLLALPLVGGWKCATTGEIKVPEVVRVPIDRYVPLDSALVAECKQEAARDQTLGEAVRLAELRRIWLEDCAARMARIRALQPKAP